MIKTTNQIIIFILEITMLVAFGLYAMNRPWNFVSRLLFAIFIISAAITLWAIFAAPKSEHRFEMPLLAIFRASMFLIAAFFLFQIGHKNISIALAVLTIITQAISYFAEE